MGRTVLRLVLCSILPLHAIPLSAQQVNQLPEDTLAEVGADVITGTDLIERIELMPWQGKDQHAMLDSSKIKALQSIVAERLLAAEAVSRGIGFDSLTQLRLRTLEGTFVRDELYKREVGSKVRVSPEEITAGLRRYASQREMLVLRCPSEKSARELSMALGSTLNVDSVAHAGFGRAVLSIDTVTVNFGIADDLLEDCAYSLDTDHPVSAPCYSQSLDWVVLVLLADKTNPAYSRQEIAGQISAVRQILRSRKARVGGAQYMASLLGLRRGETDRQVFGLLAKSMYAIIRSDTVMHKRQRRFFVAPEEIDRLEDTLRPDLGRVLVSMPDGGLTLGMAIQAFRIEPFSSPSLGRRAFSYVLNESVRRIVQEEFIAREGYKRNLQYSAPVRHDVASWSGRWLSRSMEDEIPGNGEPTEEEELDGLIEYAGVLSSSYEVNIREILTDSLSKAAHYRELLLAGEDMAGLARSVSKRKGWADRGGESGFFNVQAFPELGVRALAADTGRLIGPVRLAGGYSLFIVLGKHLASGDSVVTLDSLRNAMHSYIRSRHRQRAVDRFIAGLAEKYGVKMYYDKLRDISISPHNMFTRRYIGFGGIMNAAPLLKPEWGWVQEYIRAGNQMP
jgi:hypothetical protein